MSFSARNRFWVLLILFAMLLLPSKIKSQDPTDEKENKTSANQKKLDTPASAPEPKKKEKKKKPKKPKEDPDQIGNRDVSRGVNLYSLEKEIALGKQLAQEIEKSVKIIEDPEIAEYVNRLGQNIVRNSDAKIPFTNKVIDAEEVNAFALPGGFLFVNTGLILKAEQEAELVGVMAHEIAHVTARHGTRQASRGQIANLARIPLIFVGGGIGYGISQAVGVLVPMAFLKFSRSFEEEADLLGLQYIYRAGYDPTALIDFFEKLQTMEKRKPGTLAKIFSTHPMTDDRIKKNQKNIQQLPEKTEYVIATSEFQNVKAKLEQLLNKKKGSEEKKGPTLRKSGSGKIEEDERPPLKRRP